MTPDQIAALVDKLGVAVAMLVVLIPCTILLCRLLIGAMDRLADANAEHAKEFATMAANALKANEEGTAAAARNTVATDNLSSKIEKNACQYAAEKNAKPGG